MKKFLMVILIAFLTSSCEDKLTNEFLVYSNDFSTLDLRNFENARLFIFLGDTLAGYYNNEELAFTIRDIPPHNILKVEVELLVHDTWDGNPDDGLSGPDIWYMKVDDQEVVHTTFSNSPCEWTYCLKQSYPNDYFRQNRPKTGAIQTNLPGLCLFGAFNNYTTKYRVSRLVSHQADSVRLVFGDHLKALNSPDPLCDESWSISKVEVVGMIVN
jgi:hypothetical protein